MEEKRVIESQMPSTSPLLGEETPGTQSSLRGVKSARACEPNLLSSAWGHSGPHTVLQVPHTSVSLVQNALLSLFRTLLKNDFSEASADPHLLTPVGTTPPPVLALVPSDAKGGAFLGLECPAGPGIHGWSADT